MTEQHIYIFLIYSSKDYDHCLARARCDPWVGVPEEKADNEEFVKADRWLVCVRIKLVYMMHFQSLARGSRQACKACIMQGEQS